MLEKDWEKILLKLKRQEEYNRAKHQRKSISFDDLGEEIVFQLGVTKDYGDEPIDLKAAFAELTWKQRRIVKLIYFQGLTQKEAAELLHCSKSTVSHLLKKALNKLKKSLS